MGSNLRWIVSSSPMVMASLFLQVAACSTLDAQLGIHPLSCLALSPIRRLPSWISSTTGKIRKSTRTKCTCCQRHSMRRWQDFTWVPSVPKSQISHRNRQSTLVSALRGHTSQTHTGIEREGEHFSIIVLRYFLLLWQVCWFFLVEECWRSIFSSFYGCPVFLT